MCFDAQDVPFLPAERARQGLFFTGILLFQGHGLIFFPFSRMSTSLM